MEFIDPRVYAQQNRLYEFTVPLRMQFGPIAYEMYDKFVSKLGCPRCIFNVSDFGPMGQEGRALTNGIFIPPNYIQINLVNIALSAYDNGIDLNRTDFDKLMMCELAYCIIHEISHSTQNTFVNSFMVPAMEYANDHRMYSELIPQLELLLKRTYKIDIYHDRVDRYAGKVFSSQYQYLDPPHRLIYFIGSNACDIGEEDNTVRWIDSFPTIHVDISVYGQHVIDGYIKSNGIYNQEMGNRFIADFPQIRRIISINMATEYDDTSLNIKVCIDHPDDGDEPIVDTWG